MNEAKEEFRLIKEMAHAPKPEAEQSLDDAFPAVDPGCIPLGARIMVQLRKPKTRTAGGIQLVTQTRDIEKWEAQVAKVISIGPLAFKKRDSALPWPEGSWCEVGDFIRVPKWGGDRWEIPIPGTEENALFMILNDHEVISKVTGDPLSFKVFV